LIWLNSIGFPGDVPVTFWYENKDAMMPNPLMEKASRRIYNCDNERFSGSTKCWIFLKECEIYKVHSIDPLKYIYFSFRQWSVIVRTSTLHFHMKRNKTNCDWLLYMSVRQPLGGPWPMKAAMESRPSAVSLKVWLRETNVSPTRANLWNTLQKLAPQTFDVSQLV